MEYVVIYRDPTTDASGALLVTADSLSEAIDLAIATFARPCRSNAHRSRPHVTGAPRRH